jgi:hypothetical protein
MARYFSGRAVGIAIAQQGRKVDDAACTLKGIVRFALLNGDPF